jgi:hypothetical protein
MKVIIANFGQGNYLWPQCLRRNTVATIEDSQVRQFSLSGDREGYVDFCIRSLKTARGHTPTRSVASRWFNVALQIASTHGDIWVHREKEAVWWTITKQDAVEEALEPAHLPSYSNQLVYAIHKPAHRWSNRDREGRLLDWASIHPKAKDFLFTESTLIQLNEDNAEYVRTLIDGGDVSAWHNRPQWIAKLKAAKQAPVTHFTPIQIAALIMVRTALNTVLYSNGQIIERKQKNKEHAFSGEEEFRNYVEGLILDQEGLCALSGLPLHYHSANDDPEMHASLDRIDSQGHYAPGNLQVVCRFINRWKSDDDDGNFVRLLAAVRLI